MTQDLIATVPAEVCETMDEVRVEIDRLDRVLVRLMAERQGYIEAAGRIKTEKSEVRLPWRIEDVVAKVLRSAEREGLSKRIAEPVWRTLIECSIAHEHEKWDEVHGLSGEKIE
ncbi:MAG: chorismate mutase [Pseudomonadota bacterium]